MSKHSDSSVTPVNSAPLPSQLEEASTPRMPKFVSAKTTAVLAFQSLGAVYGDIGTSPLYTLNSVFTSTPTEKDVLGACSCIFWGLTLVVLIKYCIIVFIFGPNNGEGGIVAIYAKLARELNIGPVGVEFGADSLELLSKTETQASWMLPRPSRENYGRLKRLGWNMFKYIPITACLCGSAFLMSDGMLTPVQSVLSAIEGMEQPVPHMKQYVVLISCFILAVLFLGQRAGSAKLSMVFSPIVLLWFAMLFVIGIINIKKNPYILTATNPKHAIDYLVGGGIDNMSNVILALTGAEAMFADVGHFSPAAIRLAVIVVVYPSLFCAYMGQGAALLENPGIMPNVFYLSIPGGIGGGLYWFMFVLAILSTIIASQAIILGVFSISRQLMALDCMPQFPVSHVSSKVHGKVYIPMLNYIFMVACILCAIGFQNSNNTSAAYGLCVSMDFFITTVMIAFSIFFCHKFHWIWSVMMVCSFGLMDICFVIAEMKKVPDGAWFPLVMSAVFVSVMLLWKYGNGCRVRYEFDHRVAVGKVFKGETFEPAESLEASGEKVEPGDVVEAFDDPREAPQYQSHDLSDRDVGFQNRSLHSLRSLHSIHSVGHSSRLLIFYSNLKFTLRSPNTVPSTLKTFIDSFPTSPTTNHIILLAVNIATVPRVPLEDSVSIVPIASVPGLFRAVVTFGFMDSPKMTSQLEEEIAQRVGYDMNSETKPRKIVHVFNKQICYGLPYDKDNYIHANKLKRGVFKSVIWMRTQLIDWLYGPIEYFFNASDKSIKVLVTDPTSVPLSVTTAVYI